MKNFISTLASQAKQFKDEFEETRRNEKEKRETSKEAELIKKEASLIAYEKELSALALDLSKREKLINKLKRRPFYLTFAYLCLNGLICYFLAENYTISPITTAPSTIASPQAGNSQPIITLDKAPSSAGPTSISQIDKASAAAAVINGLDMENRSFDVGRYCLRKEAEGLVTFEQCLGMAALKVAARR